MMTLTFKEGFVAHTNNSRNIFQEVPSDIETRWASYFNVLNTKIEQCHKI